MTGTRVRVVPKGPVLISGPVRIEVPGGRVVESDRFMVAICTCARSKEYPLCDTSHRRCRSLSTADQAGAEVGSKASGRRNDD